MPNPLGDVMSSFLQSAFDGFMMGVWVAGLAILRFVFGLVDGLTQLDIPIDAAGHLTGGPVMTIWPWMRGISVTVALGLFFWQLGSTMLRGGRGFWRASTGPFAYGIALSVTVGVVAALVAGAEALTTQLLDKGLQAQNFVGALNHTSLGNDAVTALGGVVLGICAAFGVIPAAFGYLLEMIFRTAAIYVLIATIPITAAGLLSEATSSWYWKSLRWMLSAILMKPVLALTLVLGVSMTAGPAAGTPAGAPDLAQAASGLLAGVGVLLISMFCPFVLFRLFAFVDPGTNSGAAARSMLSSAISGGSASSAGSSSGGGGSGGGGEGMEAAEASNMSRFESAVSPANGGIAQAVQQMARPFEQAAGAAADFANSHMDATGIGHPGGGGASRSGGGPSAPSSSSGPGQPDDSGDGDAPAPPPDHGPPSDSGGSTAGADGPGDPGSGRPGSGPGGGGGYDPPPPDHPTGSGGDRHDDDQQGGSSGGGTRGGGGDSRGGGAGGKGGQGAAAGEAEEAAVVIV